MIGTISNWLKKIRPHKHDWEDISIEDLPEGTTFNGEKPHYIPDFNPRCPVTGMFRFYFKCKTCGAYAKWEAEGWV